VVRQEADLADLIWSVPELVSYLSGLYRLQPGDLIYTGTPAGVGAVVSGDLVVVEIDGLSALQVEIGDPAP
jgi:fumarylpyruvate hydrolase